MVAKGPMSDGCVWVATSDTRGAAVGPDSTHGSKCGNSKFTTRTNRVLSLLARLPPRLSACPLSVLLSVLFAALLVSRAHLFARVRRGGPCTCRCARRTAETQATGLKPSERGEGIDTGRNNTTAAEATQTRTYCIHLSRRRTGCCVHERGRGVANVLVLVLVRSAT